MQPHKHFYVLALSALLAPAAAACGAGDVDLGTAQNDITGKGTKTCADRGGTCVGITATIACPEWLDDPGACGGAVGVGCCIQASDGGEADGGEADGGKADSGEDSGDAGATCAELGGQCIAMSLPIYCPHWIGSPDICGVNRGCCIQDEDAGPAPDAGDDAGDDGGALDAGPAQSCVAAGGQCVGITATIQCPHWGDSREYSCGGGVGVGCCLP